MLQIPRWKAENVSTQEVANAISSLDFIEEANVYGVAMPGESLDKMWIKVPTRSSLSPEQLFFHSVLKSEIACTDFLIHVYLFLSH